MPSILTQRIIREAYPTTRTYNPKPIVVSLYEYTGTSLKPWAEAGYTCLAFDIQHKGVHRKKVGSRGGTISFIHADLWETWQELCLGLSGVKVKMLYGFPVCTDLAVSGSRHFAKKWEENPNFQEVAARRCRVISELADHLANEHEDSGVPYVIENPISVLSTLWRKPDYKFDPWEYGGYLDKHEAQHPTWPEYIADYDTYPKRTCYWTGNGFIMPEPKHSPLGKPEGYSLTHTLLGGKSDRTKNIRSASPRGIAKAIYLANDRGNNERQ